MQRCYITKVFSNFSVVVERKTTSKQYSDTFTHFQEIFLVRHEAYVYQRKLVLLPIHIENQLNTITQFKHASRIEWINAICRCAYSWTKARTEDYKNAIFMESLLWYILIRFVYRDVFVFAQDGVIQISIFLLWSIVWKTTFFTTRHPSEWKNPWSYLNAVYQLISRLNALSKRESDSYIHFFS